MPLQGQAKLDYMKLRQVRDGDAIRARQRKRWHANRERMLQQNRESRKRRGHIWNATQRAKHRKDPRHNMVQMAKVRAKKNGLPFAISVDDLVIPDRCPVLGIPLIVADGKANHNSPTIDRINNALGYVPSNIIVVSFKANTIKNSATVRELLAVTSFYDKLRG